MVEKPTLRAHRHVVILVLAVVVVEPPTNHLLAIDRVLRLLLGHHVLLPSCPPPRPRLIVADLPLAELAVNIVLLLQALHVLPHLGLLGCPGQALAGLLLHAVGQKLGEFVEQVGVVPEELRHLLEHVLDALLVLLVLVEDLQKGLVRGLLVLESVSYLRDVVDGVALLELLGLARATACPSASIVYGHFAVAAASCPRRAGRGRPCCLLILCEFNLVPLPFRQKCVEAQDELVVPAKKVLDSLNYTRSVDGLCLEVFHNLQELVVNVRLVRKLHLDLFVGRLKSGAESR